MSRCSIPADILSVEIRISIKYDCETFCPHMGLTHLCECVDTYVQKIKFLRHRLNRVFMAHYWLKEDGEGAAIHWQIFGIEMYLLPEDKTPTTVVLHPS